MTIDQSNTISLIDLCPTNLKKTASTAGGEYKGPCPVCGGRDRFSVQPFADNGGRWFCRQCKTGGDTIKFCEFVWGDDFAAACNRLGITPSSDGWQPPAKPKAVAPPVTASRPNPDAAAHGDDWQTSAAAFAVNSMAALWQPQGGNAYKYLAGRGLVWHVIRSGWLGYNASYQDAAWGDASVKLPRGVVIPWITDGHVRKVKVRRSNYDMKQQRQRLIERGVDPGEIRISKYTQAAGAISHDLYHVRPITPDRAVVMVETELDALMLQGIGDSPHHYFTAVAVGSASDGLTTANAARLAAARHVYCALDGDAAGYQAYLKWRYALGKKQISRIRYVDEKDAGEVFERFGRGGVVSWLCEQMQPVDHKAKASNQ
jgi:DNA primase